MNLALLLESLPGYSSTELAFDPQVHSRGIHPGVVVGPSSSLQGTMAEAWQGEGIAWDRSFEGVVLVEQGLTQIGIWSHGTLFVFRDSAYSTEFLAFSKC